MAADAYQKKDAAALERHLVLTWGAPVEEPLRPLSDRFLTETQRYWQRWVKQCSVPPRYQDAVIRSALALKLHCFEDTGAIIAAMTTSIPESAGRAGAPGTTGIAGCVTPITC